MFMRTVQLSTHTQHILPHQMKNNTKIFEELKIIDKDIP
jgi:pyridoxal/pyridoxine/pyridoxamine kinase